MSVSRKFDAVSAKADVPAYERQRAPLQEAVEAYIYLLKKPSHNTAIHFSIQFHSTFQTTPNMTKLFVTGVTGYIGGDAFYAIANAHPEYEITCLVRNSDKGALVAKDYPKVKLVYGDLDSSDLIEEESKKADIVLSKSIMSHLWRI